VPQSNAADAGPSRVAAAAPRAKRARRDADAAPGAQQPSSSGDRDTQRASGSGTRRSPVASSSAQTQASSSSSSSLAGAASTSSAALPSALNFDMTAQVALGGSSGQANGSSSNGLNGSTHTNGGAAASSNGSVSSAAAAVRPRADKVLADDSLFHPLYEGSSLDRRELIRLAMQTLTEMGYE
jgi:hypothetical protein